MYLGIRVLAQENFTPARATFLGEFREGEIDLNRQRDLTSRRGSRESMSTVAVSWGKVSSLDMATARLQIKFKWMLWGAVWVVAEGGQWW